MEASGIAEGVPPAATGLEPEPEPQLEPAPIQLEPEPEPHAQPHAQPEPELAPEPEPEPEQEHELQSGELQRCASRQLPAGWEAHTSQRTGETYFLNVVSYESTWERPVSAALPEGWSHNRVTQTGEVYFVAPSGESTFELPLDLAQSQYQEEEDGEEESSGGTDQEPRSEQQSRTQWLRRKTQQLVDWSDKKQRERDAAKAAAQAQLAALDAVAIEGFPRQIPSEHELPKTVTVNEHECTLVNFEQLSYSAWICDVCLRNQGKGGAFFHDGPIGTPNDSGFDCCVRCAQKHGALGEGWSEDSQDNSEFTGVYLLEGMHEGWARFVNEWGVHLYRIDGEWVLMHAFEAPLRPGSTVAAYIKASDSVLPLGAHVWQCVLDLKATGGQVLPVELKVTPLNETAIGECSTRLQFVRQVAFGFVLEIGIPPRRAGDPAVMIEYQHDGMAAPAVAEERLVLTPDVFTPDGEFDGQPQFRGAASGAVLCWNRGTGRWQFTFAHKNHSDLVDLDEVVAYTTAFEDLPGSDVKTVQVPVGVRQWTCAAIVPCKRGCCEQQTMITGGTVLNLRPCSSAVDAEVAAAAAVAASAAGMARESSLNVNRHAGQEHTEIYHGTDSRSAMMIVLAQRFRPSADGMGGKGVYITLDPMKAQGYRTHHPRGEHSRNKPLPRCIDGPDEMGRRLVDPGCLLRARARLGVMKTFSTNPVEAPVESFPCWHDETDEQGRRYNSALLSTGCICCKKHGSKCPGSRANGHNVPPGVAECRGRCKTGFRVCKSANTSLQEFVVWNPDRIDQIEIIEGPASLVGIGRELWHCEPDDKAREVTLTQAMVEAAAQSARTTAIVDERANALASKIAEFHADDAFFAEQQKARLLVVAAMAQPIRVTGATCFDADITVNGLWAPTSERAHGRVVYRKEDALDGWSSDPQWLEYDGEYNRWVFHEDSKRGTSAGSACSSAADNEPGLSDIPGGNLSDSPLAVKDGQWSHVDSQGNWARYPLCISYDMKVEGVEMEAVQLAREAQTERFAEAASRARPVVVSGTTGSFGHIINGVYLPTPERSASRVVFKKTFKNDKDLCANLILSFHDRLRRWCIVPCDDDTMEGATDSITWEGFKSILYGKYRADKVTVDHAKCTFFRDAKAQGCSVFEGLCWTDPMTTFSLNQMEPGTVTGRGFNMYGTFTVSGTWNADGTVNIMCSNQNGEFPMELKWDGAVSALTGTAAHNAGNVSFSLVSTVAVALGAAGTYVMLWSNECTTSVDLSRVTENFCLREEPQLDLLPHEASGWTAPVQEAFNAVQHGRRDGYRSEKLSVRAVEWSEAEAATKEYECEPEIDGRVDALRLYRELAGQGDEGQTRSSSSEQLQIDRAECLCSATSFPLDPRCWSQFERQDIDHQPPWGVLVVGSVQEDDDVSIAEERRRTTSDATLNLTRLLVAMGDAAAARQLFLHTIDGLTTEVGAFHLSTINAKWDFTRFLAELAVKASQADSNQVPKLSHRAQEELELLPSAKENEQEWSALSYQLSLLCDEPQKFRGCKTHSWTDDLDDCTLACKLFAQSIRELGVYILLGGSALMSKHEELNKFGFGSRGYTAEVLRSKATLGDFLWDIGACDHARHVTEQCIADQVELFGSAHARDTLEARAGLAGRLRTAYIATWLSPWARDAVRVYDELLADIQASTDSQGKQSWVPYLRLALAELLTKMGKRADAKRLLEEVIQSDNTRDHMYAVVAKRLLCTVLLHMRDVPAARRLVEEMIEASSTFHGTLHVVTLSHKLHLGRVMHASEDREQAIRLYQQLIKDCQYAVGPAHDLTKECTKRLRRVLREEALRARLPAAAAAAQEQASILGEGGQALCVSGFPGLRARSAALDKTIGLDSFNGRYVHTANDYTPEGFPVWRLCNTATMSESEGEGSATHDAESGPDEQRVLYFSPQRADWVLSTEISLSSFAAWASPNFERWAIAKPPPEMGDDDDTVAADNTTVESGVEAIGPVPLGRDQGWVVLDAGLAMPTLGNGKVDTLGRDPTCTFSNTKVIEVALTVEPGG